MRSIDGSSRRGFEGPLVVGWATVVLLVMSGAILGIAEWSEEEVRALVRATARTSLAVFLLAFVASALVRHWPSRGTRWLLRNRRYLGLSFAVSHLLHLIALVCLGRWFPHPFWDELGRATLVAGGAGFLVVGVLAATSSDRAQRLLGTARWTRLHRAGVWYLWAVFFVSYVGRSVSLTGLLLAALVLRLARR